MSILIYVGSVQMKCNLKYVGFYVNVPEIQCQLESQLSSKSDLVAYVK